MILRTKHAVSTASRALGLRSHCNLVGGGGVNSGVPLVCPSSLKLLNREVNVCYLHIHK